MPHRWKSAVSGHVTTARVCQILDLVYLATDIQEAVLFLPLTQSGRDRVRFDDLQSVASYRNGTSNGVCGDSFKAKSHRCLRRNHNGSQRSPAAMDTLYNRVPVDGH